MTKDEETTESTPLPLPCDALGIPDLKHLKDQLRKCKDQIDKDQTLVNNKKNRVSKLEADIGSFDKASAQIEQSYEEYKKAYENIEKEREILKKECDYWKQSLPTKQQDRKHVDRIIKEIDEDLIGYYRKEIDELEKIEGECELPPGSIIYAEFEFKKAQKEFKDSEKKFEDTKNRLKKINETIKKGKDSGKSIQDELNKRTDDDEKNKEYEMNAYFYFTELCAASTWLGNWIKSPNDFKDELKAALEDMQKKKIILNDNEGRLNEWKAKLEDRKKKLEAAEKSRNKDILDRLNEIPEEE